MKHTAITFDVAVTDLHSGISSVEGQLKAALESDADRVSLQLHPAISAGSDLLEWLEDWERKFSGKSKIFLIVPENGRQLACLEMSHPDQNLKYVESVEVFRTMYPPLAVKDERAGRVSDFQSESVPGEQPVAAPAGPSKKRSACKEPVIQGGADPFAGAFSTNLAEYNPDVADHIAEIGSINEISGEYACQSCGYKRMWLKSDTIKPCENAECLSPESGWQLMGDIF